MHMTYIYQAFPGSPTAVRPPLPPPCMPLLLQLRPLSPRLPPHVRLPQHLWLARLTKILPLRLKRNFTLMRKCSRRRTQLRSRRSALRKLLSIRAKVCAV